MDLPLISVITPIAGRHHSFRRGSFDCFACQTYPNLERLVMEDGPEAPPLTIGAKRNALCHKAAGQIIVHMDVDDWYGPGYVAHVVGELIGRKDGVIGSRTAYFWDVDTRQAWLYTGKGTSIVGATLAYFRNWWLAHPFASIDAGEDLLFKNAALAGGQLHYYVLQPSMVARTHQGNTCQRSYRVDAANRPAEWTPLESALLPAGFEDADGIPG